MAVVTMAIPETALPLPLIDHHVHGAVTGALDGPGVEALLTEAAWPPPPGTSMFDSQLGFAVRRWCAPLLDLEPSVPAAGVPGAPCRSSALTR